MKLAAICAVAVAALVTVGAQPASAWLVGSGWRARGTWTAFTLDDDSINIAVDFTTSWLNLSVTAHTTPWTWHRAASDCQDSSYPYGANYQEYGQVIYTEEVGGQQNHSVTPFCDDGYTLLQGGGIIESFL